MPNNIPMEYFRLWLKKAEEDELAASNLLADNGPFSPVCFHSQQMAEKVLKSLLVYKGKEFPKTHDLLSLMTMLEGTTPDIKNIHDDLDYLNNFYIEARYPDDYHSFSKEEASKSIESSLRVKDFVLGKIKEV